jgi:predicted ribosome quality control (RQC) complex YloA/Tae2 family protein
MPRQFLSPNGFPILVGKNAAENERVSFELCRPHDYWFHAKNILGAHVILQWDPSNLVQPQKEDIIFAAHAASFYSKQKESQNVPVTVARGCDLVRIPNAKKGTIQCNSAYELHTNPYLFAYYANYAVVKPQPQYSCMNMIMA